MTIFTPTDAQQRAADLLDTTLVNLFIAGRAGTGKSAFLDWYRKRTDRNVVVVAPTGVAALHVQGQTIHSFFGLTPGFIDVAHFRPTKNKKLFGAIDLLVIDEISMVRADVFDAIDMTLRANRNPSLPFGGAQICVMGDLFQLPPVVSRVEQQIYASRYETPYFFSSMAYASSGLQLIAFDTIFRQNEADFIKMLNRLRIGDNRDDVTGFFNQRHDKQLPEGTSVVTLTSTNAQADIVNSAELQKLTGAQWPYQGKASGRFEKDADKLPAPLKLELKMGAQVMFTRNDAAKKRWVNGTIGIVTGLENERVLVTVKEGRHTYTHTVTPETWTAYTYVATPEGKIQQQEAGSFTQFPLMLAWAVTIHKSQGKTLDAAVIDLGRGAFAPGQLYVALSRCKRLDGMSLVRPIRASDIRTDPAVLNFARKLARG